ncbi:MAG: ACT domain-containing protein [Fretibacterium sp.]|nr:ACT domain-containing protein [Fretibacterium sp.]
MRGSKLERIVRSRDEARIVLMGVPDVPGVAATVFSALAERDVAVQMIVQNNMRGGITDLAFLVHKDQLDDAIFLCRQAAESVRAQGVSFNTEIACVSLYGQNLTEAADLPGRMFAALARSGVNIQMIGSNALSLTCVVAETAADKAIEALHREFLELFENPELQDPQ